MNHLVEPIFQRVNRLFVLAFEYDEQRASNERYYLPNVEINHYKVTIDGKIFFDQPIKNNKKHMKTIQKLLLLKEMIIQQVFIRLRLRQRNL